MSYTDPRTVTLAPSNDLILRPPFPNPARGQVTLRYAHPTATTVSIKVFDVMGRQVTTLRRGAEDPGRKEVRFTTSRLSSGIYFIRLQAGNREKTQRLTVLE